MCLCVCKDTNYFVILQVFLPLFCLNTEIFVTMSHLNYLITNECDIVTKNSKNLFVTSLKIRQPKTKSYDYYVADYFRSEGNHNS